MWIEMLNFEVIYCLLYSQTKLRDFTLLVCIEKSAEGLFRTIQRLFIDWFDYFYMVVCWLGLFEEISEIIISLSIDFELVFHLIYVRYSFIQR